MTRRDWVVAIPAGLAIVLIGWAFLIGALAIGQQ